MDFDFETVKNTVYSILLRLDNSDGFSRNEVFKIALLEYDLHSDEVDTSLLYFMDLGLLYEPKLGTLKLIQ